MRSTATSAERSSAEDLWRVEEACPQCGGRVRLSLGDRLLQCPYCRVRLVLIADAHLRYFLPARRAESPRMLYAPYWRLKGLLYNTIAGELRHSIVDRTIRACQSPGLPPTLGVRPQALTIRIAPPAVRCLDPDLGLAQAVAECCRDCAELEEEEILEQNFLGTRVMLLHLPIEIRDGIYDGVLDRKIAELPAQGRLAEALQGNSAESARSEPAVRFLPALCPSCGSDVDGESDSLVLHCRSCAAAWMAGREQLERMSYEVVPASWRPTAHLPFWRLQARIEGASLKSFADLIQFANLPRTLRPEDDRRPLWLWFPAFKVNPEHFLRLSRALSVNQPAAVSDAALTPDSAPFPVTLPLRDGAAMVRVLLFDLTQPKSPFLAALRSVKVRIEQSVLTYLPFAEERGELAHREMQLVLPRKLLEFGRGL